MSKGNKKICSLATVVLAALLSILLFASQNGRMIAAVFLAIATPVVCLVIRKRVSFQISKKEVLLLSMTIATLFVLLVLFSGLRFGFYKNPYFMKTNALLKIALPTAVIIIATEIIRCIFLSQKSTFASVSVFVSCVVAEAITTSTIPEIKTFNGFMDLVGLTLFPAIIANVYYHYSSKRFGMLPNIAFRMILALYVYFVPTTSGMSNALLSCLKMLLPIIMLVFISATYEKQPRKARRKGGKISALCTVLSVAVILSIAALISCQFRFGAIVIATESMTGEINKGDMIIYERYDGQKIEEGQVIVFLENNRKIVHRVVGIETVGGEIRYYTKGDANEDYDSGYRVQSDILGLTDVKVAGIGYPTLWLRELIKNSK